MYDKIVPVSPEKHKNTKIRKLEGLSFAKGLNLAGLMVHEFARAASIYPIVFLEDAGKTDFRPVVLMGLEPGENLFLKADDKWDASYVPAILRRYPFTLAKTTEEGKFAVCLDEGCEAVNEEDGESLFDAEGKPSALLSNARRYLAELQQMEIFAREFCQHFTSKNMFTPLNMRVREVGKVRNITGCYVINEERLNNLSDEALLELRQKKYLAAVYAHLISLGQIERLVQLKEKIKEPEAAPAPAKKSKT